MRGDPKWASDLDTRSGFSFVFALIRSCPLKKMAGGLFLPAEERPLRARGLAAPSVQVPVHVEEAAVSPTLGLTMFTTCAASTACVNNTRSISCCWNPWTAIAPLSLSLRTLGGQNCGDFEKNLRESWERSWTRPWTGFKSLQNSSYPFSQYQYSFFSLISVNFLQIYFNLYPVSGGPAILALESWDWRIMMGGSRDQDVEDLKKGISAPIQKDLVHKKVQ